MQWDSAPIGLPELWGNLSQNNNVIISSRNKAIKRKTMVYMLGRINNKNKALSRIKLTN